MSTNGTVEQVALTDVLAAANTIAPYLKPTPLHHYPMLSALLDANVYVKHENYLPIGAFKVRGGVNFLAHLSDEERARGVVTASTGNHGQSIAYAAQIFGLPAAIVVPEGANPVKVEAMRAYGADVIFHGPDFETAKGHCSTLEAEQGMRFISSGDEPLLIAGVGTHTLEIMQALPEAEMIFVPVGGGSGAAGASLTAKSIKPDVKVIAVQATGAPAAYLTWRDGTPHETEISTFAGGLQTGAPFMMPQAIMRQYLDDFLLVEDEELMWAVRLFLEKAKTLAEPAGASSLAAALRMRDEIRGKTVVLILSGGNISPDELMLCLQQTNDRSALNGHQKLERTGA